MKSIVAKAELGTVPSYEGECRAVSVGRQESRQARRFLSGRGP